MIKLNLQENREKIYEQTFEFEWDGKEYISKCEIFNDQGLEMMEVSKNLNAIQNIKKIEDIEKMDLSIYVDFINNILTILPNPKEKFSDDDEIQKYFENNEMKKMRLERDKTLILNLLVSVMREAKPAVQELAKKRKNGSTHFAKNIL